MKVPKGIHVVTDALVKTINAFIPTFLMKSKCNTDYTNTCTNTSLKRDVF